MYSMYYTFLLTFLSNSLDLFRHLILLGGLTVTTNTNDSTRVNKKTPRNVLCVCVYEILIALQNVEIVKRLPAHAETII